MGDYDLRLDKEDFYIEEIRRGKSGGTFVRSPQPTGIGYQGLGDLTPFARMNAIERNNKVRKKMIKLKESLEKCLDPIESVFLSVILGGIHWEKRLYWRMLLDVDSVPEFVSEKLPDVKERLRILRERFRNQSYRIKEKALEYISRPYTLMLEREVIDYYKKVLANCHAFPPEFFSNDGGRNAAIVTHYLLEEVLKLDPEEIFSSGLSRKFFVDNKLGHMLQTRFNNSVTDALKNAYPERDYPHLYSSNGDGSELKLAKAILRRPTGLSHLLDNVNERFEEQ